MTNAVGRMYKEYGVEKRYMPLMSGDKVLNDKFQAYYPPFTAEKQIELIKLLAETYVLRLENDSQHEYFFSVSNLRSSGCLGASGFENSLADLIINLKKYLDAAKVKEILENG